MTTWREPEWQTGQCALPQPEWPQWRDSYLAGHHLPCRVCDVSGPVTLSPVRHVVIFHCGHIMELPERTDL